MINNLPSRRYEPPTIDVNQNNCSRALTIDLVGLNKHVLEIGTSTGYVTKILKDHGNIVTGIERDCEAGLNAKQYCDQLIEGDIETLNLDEYLQPESFDIILLGDVLEHLEHPADILKKLKKYLRTDGYLVVSLPNFCHGDVILNILNGDFHYTSTGLLDETHLRFFGLKNIFTLFSECGYNITDLRTTNLNVGCTELKQNFENIPEYLIKFIESLPNSTVYQFIFTARPSTNIVNPTNFEPDLDKLAIESFEELTREIRGELENQISLLNKQNLHLLDSNQQINKELDDIKCSVTWQLVTKFHKKIIERYFSPETRRRKTYNLGLKYVKLLVNSGTDGFLSTSHNYDLSHSGKHQESVKSKKRKKSIDTLRDFNGKDCNGIIGFVKIENLKMISCKSILFIKSNGITAFIHRIGEEFKFRKHAFLNPSAMQPNRSLKVSKLLNDRFINSRPLQIYQAPIIKKRVNLVTDSINMGTLFGGVATAIIFSVLLANRWGCDLRVITRIEKPNEGNFGKILKLNNISFIKNVEFCFADIQSSANKVDVSKEDIFITTSWWTTRSVLQSVDRSRIIYLLQEDERMFYPFDDDRLKCTEILTDNNLRYVINSKLLFDHFISEGFSNIGKNGIWFEPSFDPKCLYLDNSISTKKEKKKFFFYARPRHPRNLFYLGVEVIAQAVERRIIDTNDWEIYFVGKDIPQIFVSANYSPIIVPVMGWDEYCSFVRTVDLGLCLMYTPHPSYPPLDLAASGAIVVTNTFENKQNLSCYSENIICTDPNVESLLQGLAEGISLAENSELRLRNYKENRLSRDWNLSFHDVLRHLSQD